MDLKSKDFYNKSNKLVKAVVNIKVEVLTCRIKAMYNQCAFPNILKISKVSQFTNKQLASSYQPISLVSVFGKVFEVLLKDITTLKIMDILPVIGKSTLMLLTI